MDNQLFRDIQTDLDLNGPVLSFTTQPVDATINVGQNATFIAVATVSFPGDSSPANTGTIAYQWYGPNGILTEGTKYVGTKTTTLTIVDVVSPVDVGSYYVVVDYVPSSETGNAINEPFRSDNGNLIAPPLIEINAQPTPITTIASEDRNFNIDATLSDNGTDIGFQWQLDGENVSDGTVTKSTVTTIPGTTKRRITQYAPTGGQLIDTIPAGATDVLFEIAGGGGGKGGGNFVNTQGANRVGGRGGKSMTGWFHLADSFYIDSNPLLGLKESVYFVLTAGRKGSDGVVGSRTGAGGGTTPASRGDGGNGGAHGWGHGNGTSSGDAGGGGGGGAASYIYIKDRNAITAGGGGGGGGAFNNTSGPNHVGSGDPGMDAGPVRMSPMVHNYNPPVMQWITSTSIVPIQQGNGGTPGHNGQGIDTPGGGGGGGGYNGGQGGHHGHRPSGSPAGQQGSSGYDPLYVYYRSGSSGSSDGWAGVHYTHGSVPTTQVVNVTRTTTISGSLTNQLTLNTDGPGIGYTVSCNVSSSIASNSPVTSDVVDYHVESTVNTGNIVVEGIGLNQTLANISTTDLSNGELILDSIGTGFVGIAPTIQLYSLYAPDKDLDVEMDLYGGGASDQRSGEGGFARIRFTMVRNEEYVIAGLTDNVNTPFLYRGGTLIACVGEGGKSSPIGSQNIGRGGDGGGINIPGGDATSVGGTGGGAVVGLRNDGKFGSAYISPLVYPEDRQSGDGTGGHTIRCSKGIYWREQGASPCEFVGRGADGNIHNSQFRLAGGEVVTNTGTILRGYKAGYNIIQTAGGGRGGWRGGNGASGGDGGQGPNRAGGGGSGYSDGSVTIVSTTQGGSTSDAKVVIRVVT